MYHSVLNVAVALPAIICLSALPEWRVTVRLQQYTCTYHPCFDSYSVYYENLLRVKHQLLYQKELEVKHYKDKLKNAKDNTYTEVRAPKNNTYTEVRAPKNNIYTEINASKTTPTPQIVRDVLMFEEGACASVFRCSVSWPTRVRACCSRSLLFAPKSPKCASRASHRKWTSGS